MDENTLIPRFYDMVANFKDQLLELIPNIILSLIVLCIGYLVGRLVKFIIIRSMRYFHKLLIQRFDNSIQYINVEQSANFIGTTFFWVVLASVFVLISDILGLSIITTWMESILRYSPNILAAMLIVLIAVIFGRIAASIISSVSTKVGLTYGKTLGRIVHYVILATSTIIAIDQIGIEVTILTNLIDIVLAALLFGAALAFGLGARTSVSNILAAFYVRKMFKVGDQVKIDDIQGKITKIDATSVVLDTKTGQTIVPAKIFNESKSLLIKNDHK